MNWWPFAIFLPDLAYLIYSYPSGPRGYSGVFDAATIKEEKVINKHVRIYLIKTAFYIVNFIVSLYCSVLELATN